jgi:hypothetical protein
VPTLWAFTKPNKEYPKNIILGKEIFYLFDLGGYFVSLRAEESQKQQSFS